jgi:hypothetical protein
VAELEAAERELEALKAAHVGRQSELQGLYRRRAYRSGLSLSPGRSLSPPQPSSSRAATEASIMEASLLDPFRHNSHAVLADWDSRSGPAAVASDAAGTSCANGLASLESVELESLCPICLETRPQAMHARICSRGSLECADTCCRGCLFSHVMRGRAVIRHCHFL